MKSVDKDVLWMWIKGIILVAAIAYLFYDSILAILMEIPFLIFFIKKEKEKLQRKKLELLEENFKETLLSLLAALRAGYSVENAFIESYQDMRARFGDENVMAKELLFINRQIKNNIPVEHLLDEFANRSGSGDIKDFAIIFRIAKRSGGNMVKIMERTVSLIARRMEVKEQIRLIVASKRYEQQIMDLVPMGIIFYIRFANPGFFDPLYHNFSGVVIMTIALFLYGVAYFISEKILEIA